MLNFYLGMLIDLVFWQMAGKIIWNCQEYLENRFNINIFITTT